VIIAQEFRDVGMEHFVDDYFSVKKFKKAYERRVEQIGSKDFWPKVEIAPFMGAPLAKGLVGRQRKNRIKGCLEGGSGKKAESKDNEKTRKLVRGKYRCPNCGELGHQKNNPKCRLNGSKKRSVLLSLLSFLLSKTTLITLFLCRKRKPRKNTTK
jgi:hypothetical protein